MSLGKRETIIYSLVTVNNMTSIDQIASTLGIDSKKAQKIIQNMIDTSNAAFSFANDALLFKNAQIDHLNRKIILDPNSANIQKNPLKSLFSQKTTVTAKVAVEQRNIVICDGCGAENTIMEGKITECEYCGASIK